MLNKEVISIEVFTITLTIVVLFITPALIELEILLIYLIKIIAQLIGERKPFLINIKIVFSGATFNLEVALLCAYTKVK